MKECVNEEMRKGINEYMNEWMNDEWMNDEWKNVALCHFCAHTA